LNLRILGNAGLGLAVVLYIVSLRFVMGSQASRGESTTGTAFGLAFFLISLWSCLAIALSVVTAVGGLDWMRASRGAQHAFAVAICLAMMVVTWFAGAMATERADQIPWGVRPLTPWAVYVFAPVVILFVLLTLNPQRGLPLPPLALRIPFGLVCGVSLLVAFGLLLQAVLSAQAREQRRVTNIVSEMDERHQRQLEEVRGLDAEKDFGELLAFTNRYNQADVRGLAFEKLHSNPNFQGHLTESLRSDWSRNAWSMNALIFLDANDPPDGKALAEPARDAILAAANHVRDGMRREVTLRPDDFGYEARLVLSVADKLHGLGVDFTPAIRAFRIALDEPRRDKVTLDCVTTLDAWLAREAKGPR
jgi:hypothetical protein